MGKKRVEPEEQEQQYEEEVGERWTRTSWRWKRQRC